MALWKQVRPWAAAVLLSAGELAAQPAVMIPASSDAYRRIEALSAFFAVPVHLGLRPMSVRAFSGTLARIEDAIHRAAPDHPRRAWALAEVSELRASVREVGVRPVLGSWATDAYAGNAQSARIEDNGLGLLDAVESPFATDRRGLPAPRGGALSILPTVAVAGGRYAAVVQPDISLSFDANGTDQHLRVHRAYGRGVWRNVALQLGADAQVWGQAVRGPLFISRNAAPFPFVAVGTDTSITLPWLFGLAGPVHGRLLVADLGPTQVPRHARLAGWQVNMHPWSRFELGVAVLAHTGGDGGPKATFLERVIDLLPLIDALAPQAADLQFSNKIAGGNLRIRFPEWSGLDVYYELAIDDFDGRRLLSSFVDDAGHLLGARIAAGPMVWRGELHRTSIRLYEHTQFQSGVTYRQRLIGSPLGPHARAAYLMAEWPVTPTSLVEITAGNERRDPSQFTVTVSGDRDRGFRFIRLTDDPDVRRAVVVASLEQRVSRAAIRVSAGYNRAWRSGGAPRHEWAVRLTARSHLLPVF